MGGGIEFLRTDGPYSQHLIVIDTKHLQSDVKLKSYIDQARIYVRPVQLNTDPVEREERLAKIFSLDYL